MNKSKLLLVIFCILLPLFLLLFSYKIVLGIVNLNENQQRTIDYLQKDEELNLGYTNLEFSHLQDVRKVMKAADYLFYFSLLILTLIFTYHKKDRKQLAKLLKCGGIATISFMLAILLLSALFFNQVFALFHQIFFPQGNWTFASDSLLIQIFPLEFFIGISRNIFVLTIIEGIIFILLFFYLKNDFKNRRN